ncbi:MAG TPA: helix-turn-helix domain-containing protein [Sporichthyaceae bacterium]
MNSLGAQLRDARREAGLTQFELAEITRIRVGRLVQFEADDFSGLDSTVLAHGRLDAIARAVGVDAAPLVSAYDAGHPDTPPPSILWRGPGWGTPGVNWTKVLVGLLGLVAVYPVALLVAMVLG